MPPWKEQLQRRLTSPSSNLDSSSSFNSSSPLLHSNNIDSSRSSVASSLSSNRRFSALEEHDLNQIDGWLDRLNRLEGATALPAKVDLRLLPRRGNSYNNQSNSNSHSDKYSGEPTSEPTSSRSQYSSRRSSLQFFPSSSITITTTSDKDRRKSVATPSEAVVQARDLYTPSPRPSSQLEPEQRYPSHFKPPSSTTILPNPLLGEVQALTPCSPTKAYVQEDEDGSYIVLTARDELESEQKYPEDSEDDTDLSDGHRHPSPSPGPPPPVSITLPFWAVARGKATNKDHNQLTDLSGERHPSACSVGEDDHDDDDAKRYGVATRAATPTPFRHDLACPTAHYTLPQDDLQAASAVKSVTESANMSSPNMSDRYEPTGPTIPSSHSVKSVSTTSSHPSSGKSINNKLQPRSPFASPINTFSSRKGRKFPRMGRRSLESTSDDDNDDDDAGAGTGEVDHLAEMRAELASTSDGSLPLPLPRSSSSRALFASEDTHHRLPSSASYTSSIGSGPISAPASASSRLKKLSKGSFTSSADSLRANLMMGSSSTNNNNNNQGQIPHSRKQSSDSKASSSTHSYTNIPFFSSSARNSNKHPQTCNPTESLPASSSLNKLVARDERFVSRVRPRLTSARSASSLRLGSSAGHDGGNASDAENDEEEDDLAMLNPRRASISSTSPSYQRSRDDRRALASSINRISLAVPPPLMRSYSYDGQISAAAITGTGYDTSENLAKNVPDLEQSVLLWIPDQSTTNSAAHTHPSSSTKGYQHHSSVPSRGFANVILSNVPLHGRKKVSRRESAQLLSTDVDEQINAAFKHYQSSSSMDKDKSKSHQSACSSSTKGKEKEKASILLPPGQWKRCEAVLKPSGQLLLSHGAITLTSVQVNTLKRTDIRLVDPSLLGRQRCISIHVKNGTHLPLPLGTSAMSDTKHGSSSFPLSPSAPDFLGLATLALPPASSSSTSRRPLSSLQESPYLTQEAQSVYLSFPSAAAQHTWIASLLCHSQPEIYPRLASSSTSHIDKEADLIREDELDDQEQGLHRQHSEKRDPSIDYPIRMYRSISLQIVQARLVTDAGHAHNVKLHAEALHSLMSSSTSTSSLPSPGSDAMPQRKGSIASVYTAATSVDGSISTQGSVHGRTSLPPTSASTVAATFASQARSGLLGHSTSSQATNSGAKKSEVHHKEKEKGKDDLRNMFCEIWLDGEMLGRTGVKRYGSNVIWEEVFHFGHLPPYQHPLMLYFYAIRKNVITPIGHTALPLHTMQRNIQTSDWYEISPNEQATKHGHFETSTEVNLGVHLKEDVALPFKAYSALGMLLSMDTGSSVILGILKVLKIELDIFAQALLRIDIAHRRVLHRIIGLAEKEVKARDTIATLFRGNGLLTKTVEMYMRVVAYDYLDSSVGQVLRKMCEEGVYFEIDPAKLEHRESLKENVEGLEKWIEAIWQAIYNSRQKCPVELRRIFRKIRQIVDQHCLQEQEEGRISAETRERAHFTSVSAFISLRLLGPAILRPNLFRLCPTNPPDLRTSRTLTLIAKVLNGMANLQTFGDKEPWMAAMNPFVQRNLSSYQDFITYLCSKEEGVKSDWAEKDFEMYRIPNLKRLALSPDIVKEGVPELPFLIDLPKEYAAFAALVGTAEYVTRPSNIFEKQPSISDEERDKVEEIIAVCQTLHGQTRARVRTLAKLGDLPHAAQDPTRRLRARTEEVRLPTRMRGSTVSKSTNLSTPSPDRSTASRAGSGSAGSASRRAHLFASSPPSVATGPFTSAKTDLSASTSSSTSLGSSSDSLQSPHSLLNRRRSHTVSAGDALTELALEGPPSVPAGTIVRPLPLRRATRDEEDGDHSDILDIRNPSNISSASSSPAHSLARPSPRRLTLTTSRSYTSYETLQSSAQPTGSKTPRAPTFTREQSDTLRALQEDLAQTAPDSPDASFASGLSSPRADYSFPSSNPTVSPAPKRKLLFRKK